MKISPTSHNDYNCNSNYSTGHVINTTMLFSLALFKLAVKTVFIDILVIDIEEVP